MSSNDIQEKVQEVMREVFNDDSIEIFDEMTADDIEEWDSVEHITLIYSLENEFNIKFKTEEIGGIHNVGEFIKVIRNKINH